MVNVEKIRHLEKCGEICLVEIFIHMRNVDTDQFCRKICFVTIYAYLTQNMFCRDSRAFAWRKVKPKFVPVEKKGQISGMVGTYGTLGRFVTPIILPGGSVGSSPFDE